MFQRQGLWEDAYRISRIHAGDTAEKQIAYLWARSLGGDSAIKLLNRLGHMESVIEIAATNGAFDFAFELAKSTGLINLICRRYKLYFCTKIENNKKKTERLEKRL